jgi:hypothetical protein
MLSMEFEGCGPLGGATIMATDIAHRGSYTDPEASRSKGPN